MIVFNTRSPLASRSLCCGSFFSGIRFKCASSWKIDTGLTIFNIQSQSVSHSAICPEVKILLQALVTLYPPSYQHGERKLLVGDSQLVRGKIARIVQKLNSNAGGDSFSARGCP